MHPEVNIHAQLMYVGGVKHNPINGSPYKNCIFYNARSAMLGTIWNTDYFELEENSQMYSTNLKRKDYFGVLLYTTSKTVIMPSSASYLFGSELRMSVIPLK